MSYRIIQNTCCNTDAIKGIISTDIAIPKQVDIKKFSCSICFSEKTTYNWIEDHDYYKFSCGHMFCKRCIMTYTTAQINNAIFNILNCPSCRCIISYDDLDDLRGFGCSLDTYFSGYRAILRYHNYNVAKTRYGDKLLLENIFNTYYHGFCRAPRCGIVINKPKECRVTDLSHPDFVKEMTTCEKCLQRAIAVASNMPTTVANNATIKKCPGCKASYYKYIGCNYMKCTACKTCFCDICREIFEPDLPEYIYQNHYVNNNSYNKCKENLSTADKTLIKQERVALIEELHENRNAGAQEVRNDDATNVSAAGGIMLLALLFGGMMAESSTSNNSKTHSDTNNTYPYRYKASRRRHGSYYRY